MMEARSAAPLFAALGDETRLGLIRRLSRDGPGSIAELSSEARVSRQAVTKHLEVLSSVGLARSRREGRRRVWSLEPARLGEARAFLAHVSRQWDDALERLRLHVEDP